DLIPIIVRCLIMYALIALMNTVIENNIVKISLDLLVAVLSYISLSYISKGEELHELISVFKKK
ncbi:MAG: lipopolysaccharide biosynthesis protein, partial [Bacteroidaceae bacterium]